MKKIYAINKERFETLPIEVQEQCKNTLKAYDSVNVIFEYGKYHVSTMIGITATYAEDHEYIGNVYADDIFTEEERIINYAESFHDFSPLYKGKRDYKMMNDAGYDWNIKFKMVDGILVRA